jgi:hypothetical protein
MANPSVSVRPTNGNFENSEVCNIKVYDDEYKIIKSIRSASLNLTACAETVLHAWRRSAARGKKEDKKSSSVVTIR